jgi:hypothetical protein
MNSSISVVEIWKSFHWSFFVNTQGLIICLGRFEQALEKGDLREANLEFATAASLLEASSAAMELAGSFSRQDYESVVRPSMLPPEVSEDNFSGLMSWDHSTLIQRWKKTSAKIQKFATRASRHPSRLRKCLSTIGSIPPSCLPALWRR